MKIKFYWKEILIILLNYLERANMKILTITDILVLRFYGYIGDISMDILEKNIDKPKIDQNP